MSINQDIVKYLSKQKSLAKDRAMAYVQDVSGSVYPRRDLYQKIKHHIEKFLAKTSETRWLIMPGLRGIGKTTLMAQLYLDLLQEQYQNSELNLYFVSLDELSSLYGSNLVELLAALEYLEGEHFERMTKHIILFLDEVQYDEKWALAVKTLYDKTKNIFILCSGSSAIALQSNADVARRAVFEKLTPLSFIEYQAITNTEFKTTKAQAIQKKLREIIFFSCSADEVYKQIKTIEKEINPFIYAVDEIVFEDYLSIGTLAFALKQDSKTQTYDAINKVIDRIIDKDISKLANFDLKTSSKIKRLLFILSDIDTISITKLSEVLDIDRLVVNNILEALEQSELLIKVPAYGANLKAVKKPSKYLFMSSALRMAFYAVGGNEQVYLSKQGRLLEDLFASYFYQNFLLNGSASLNYDASEGSADFILQIANRERIAVELGQGVKDSSQLIKTMKKIKCSYGILLSSSKLFYDEEHNIIRLPKEYLLFS